MKNKLEKLNSPALFFYLQKQSSNFCFEVEMQDKIDFENLTFSVNKAFELLPYFNVSIEKNLFNCYYKQNENKFIIENQNFKQDFFEHRNANLLKVAYWDRNIFFYFSHALCDGKGAQYFVEQVLIYYTKSLNDNFSIKVSNENAYQKYAKKQHFMLPTKGQKTYEPLSNTTLNFIDFSFNLNKLYNFAKSKNMTISEYIIFKILIAIEKSDLNCNNLSCKISLPVNLRKHYKSNTIRNFMSPIYLKFSNNNFEKIKLDIKSQLEKQLSNNHLNKCLYFSNFFDNFPMKILPIFIKKILINFMFAGNNRTINISNLGKFRSFSKVNNIKVILPCGTQKSILALGISSFNNQLNCIFTNRLKSNFYEIFKNSILNDINN